MSNKPKRYKYRVFAAKQDISVARRGTDDPVGMARVVINGLVFEDVEISVPVWLESRGGESVLPHARARC